MQTATGKSPAPGSAPATGSSFDDAGFARMLASLTDPQNREAAWNNEELADDVATISYEPALRGHTRPIPGDSPREPEIGGEIQAAPNSHSDALPPLKPAKTARLTIRLSESESAQLRQRAAEARMTVSEYLRSCALEAESLRAQVKDALAELRNPPSAPAARETRMDSNGGFSTTFHRLWNWFGHSNPAPATH